MAKKRRTNGKEKLNGLYQSPNVPMSAIRQFAKQIAIRFHPEKIILFGSYAYGKPHRDSDVVILVVMPSVVIGRRRSGPESGGPLANKIGQRISVQNSLKYRRLHRHVPSGGPLDTSNPATSPCRSAAVGPSLASSRAPAG
jgi:hypothetical protein